MRAMTVRGPVEADDLGVVSPHEHLLIDLTYRWARSCRSGLRAIAEAPLTIDRLGVAQRNLGPDPRQPGAGRRGASGERPPRVQGGRRRDRRGLLAGRDRAGRCCAQANLRGRPTSTSSRRAAPTSALRTRPMSASRRSHELAARFVRRADGRRRRDRRPSRLDRRAWRRPADVRHLPRPAERRRRRDVAGRGEGARSGRPRSGRDRCADLGPHLELAAQPARADVARRDRARRRRPDQGGDLPPRRQPRTSTRRSGSSSGAPTPSSIRSASSCTTTARAPVTPTTRSGSSWPSG